MVTYDGTHVLSVEVASSATRSLEPAGLPPPTAPRKVSSRAYNPQGGAGFMVLLGAFFLFLGAVFLIASLATFFTSEELEPAPLVIALVFGLVFGTVGATVLTSSYRTRSMRKRLYANGMAATATVDRSAPNRMFHVNGRSPHSLDWTFVIHDVVYHGKRASFSKEIESIKEGDPIWVLYDPENPQRSVEWPPM